MRSHNIALGAAFVIAAAMIFFRLGAIPLRDPDEGRNAEVAVEMALNNAWLTPTLNGLPYLDKPAFFFRAVACSFSIFGESEWAARLPSAISAIVLLGIVYAFARKEYGGLTPQIAAIVLATTPSFFALARHVLFDMMLGLFVCGAIFAGYFAESVAEARRSKQLYLVSSIFAGLATLVKGPVGFLAPVLVLGSFNVVEKQSGWWRRLFHPWNGVVFLAVTLPWFIGLSLRHPDFPHYGLVEETFGRFTTGSFHRKQAFYFYGIVVLAGFFAWSLTLPFAARAAWKLRKRWSRADRFLAVWTIVIIGFFSLSSSKLPHYILSALVALSLLVARVFNAAISQPTGEASKVTRNAAGVLSLMAIAITAFLSINSASPQLLKSLFRNSHEFDRISAGLPATIPIAVVLVVISMAAFWSRRPIIALVAFLVTPLGLVTFGFSGIASYSEASSSRALARSLPIMPRDTRFVCVQCFPCGLPFYSGRRVTVVTEDGAELTSNYIKSWLRRQTVWPECLVRSENQGAWIGSRRGPIFLIANKRSRDALEAIASARGLAVTQLAHGYWGLLIT